MQRLCDRGSHLNIITAPDVWLQAGHMVCCARVKVDRWKMWLAAVAWYGLRWLKSWNTLGELCDNCHCWMRGHRCIKPQHSVTAILIPNEPKWNWNHVVIKYKWWFKSVFETEMISDWWLAPNILIGASLSSATWHSWSFICIHNPCLDVCDLEDLCSTTHILWSGESHKDSLFNSSTQSLTSSKVLIYTVCIYFKCTSQSLAEPLLYSLMCFKLKLITVCLH